MSMESYDYLFKLLLVGDSAVGKTSLLLRFTSGEFKDSIRNTVGVDLKVKMVNYRDRKLKLTIWDTGQHRCYHTHPGCVPVVSAPLALIPSPSLPAAVLCLCVRQPVRSGSVR
jgi:small GTP-binding protein